MAGSDLLNRVIWTAVSGGAGSFVESGAVQGYQTMEAAGAADATVYHYAAQTADLSQWEYGTALWTAATKTLGPRTVQGNNLGTTAAINFASAPLVMVTALVQDFVFQPANGNLQFFVTPTGNDNNPGTAAFPFATPQRAATVANSYDYQGVYRPTIDIAGGTYTDNGNGLVLQLPALRNPGLAAFPTIHLSGPVTFSVAATGGALALLQSPNCNWEFTGSKLTCDCFGTAITAAGDMSLEIDIDFQDTGIHGFNGEFLTCINPQNTGQIACFQAKTWQILCPKLANFITANQLSTPNFINNVTFKLPVGGVDMSGAGGFFFILGPLALLALGNGCSFTGGPATGGGQYAIENFAQLAGPAALLAAIPGDPSLNQIDGMSGFSDDNGHAKIFNSDAFPNYQQPTTGFSITIASNDNEVILDPSGTLATGTVTMPPFPQDGQKITVRSSHIITALTVAANAGQTLAAGAPTTLPAGGSFQVYYKASDTTWYFGNGAAAAGATGANPTATASDVAVNGSAATFMRSDAAPAVQKTSSSQFGLCKVDGTTITATGGVISSSGGGGSPGGATNSVQYNAGAGSFGGATGVSINGSGNPDVAATHHYDYAGSFFAGTDANENLFIGLGTGNFGTISGSQNVFIGNLSGNSATSGNNNTAVGRSALQHITTGGFNVAMGNNALVALTTGSANFGLGYNSLSSLIANDDNVAVGDAVMLSITDGYNVGIGSGALHGAATGNETVAIGRLAGFNATSDSASTYVGARAGQNVTSGSQNTLIGGWKGPSSSLSNVIGLSDGAGTLELDYNYTNASKWTFASNINIAPFNTAGLLQTDASGNITTDTSIAAASVAANFTADHRLAVSIAGTTYYLAASTTAW